MMPGITASALMDGQGKQVANILKPTYWLAVDIDKIPDEKMQEVIAKTDKENFIIHLENRFGRLTLKFYKEDDYINCPMNKEEYEASLN